MKHLCITTILLTLLMSMLGIEATAHDIAVANSDGITIYYIWANNSTELSVSYRGSSYSYYSNEYTGSVVIPETVTYNGATYSVTSIVDYAFYNCSGLTSVTIPNTVTSIGDYAFNRCSGLTSVTIPNSVTSIDNSAFYGCSGLTEVNFNATNCTLMGSYNYPVFQNCSSLTTLNIGDNVQNIPAYAFYNCSGLTSVTIPNSVTSIGDYAFYNCSGLTSVTIPNSVTYICNCAFLETGIYTNSPNGVFYVDKWACGYKGTMPSNTSITLQEGTVGIAAYAFSGCSGLTSVTIPNSVTSIGSGAFYGCSGLTSVAIPNSVTSIGSSAFSGCSSLTSVTIPNSVTSIGERAFYYCSGLQSVVVGNGVTSIPDGAFNTGTNIKSLTVGAGVLSIYSSAFGSYHPIKTIWLTNTPPSNYTSAAGTINYVANNLYTSLSNKTEYKFLSSLFEVDGVKYVPVSPSERTCDAIDCLYNENAENIHIGKTVTNQGITLTVKQVHSYAFYQNQYIKDVDLSFDGNVGTYAFCGCSKMESATVKNIGNVGGYAFSSITGTGTLTADINNAGTIGANTFDGSTRLTTLQIGNKVTNIGDYAFNGCTGLTTATINNKGTLGNYVFQGNTAMTTATLGEEITSLGSYAFDGCSSLQSIVIPNAVKTIGQYGFQNCTTMTSVQMGTGVTSIATYTFAGCSALTNMQIGSNVTTINTYAFSGCTSLPKISIPRAVTTINNYVFYGCSDLKTVTMEDRETVLSLGSNGSSPLFSSCPLDSVYIGGDISYSTSSSYGYSPFYRNTTLQTVTITDKETEISQNEFYGCTNLKNVSIGDGVESIGNWAFSGCSSLEYFAFGTALQTIGTEAFSDCTAVTQIISRAATPPTCGSQALDDINKWTCKLSVPPGGVAAYQAADQWKEFFFIQEENAADLWFKLTYMVDGEEYKVYNKLYGTTITPEPEPEKEGYTFSGWSPIPETMPARDVIIVGTFSKNPEEQPYEPDLTQTDNVIYINSAEVRVGSELTLAIKMKNNVAIRGFQFDLYLPDGVTPVKSANGKIKASLTADRLPEDDEHTLTVSEQADGAIRFLCGSQYDETFTGTDGEIATIKLNIAEDMEAGNYPMVLRNIKLTETDINKYYVADGISAILVVMNHVIGDINSDDIVDVSDYIGIANHIMGNTPEGFNENAADVNTDNAIDVSDYIGVANIIMTGSVYGNNTNGARGTMKRTNTDVSTIDNVIYIEPLSASAGTQMQLSLKMKNTAAIRGFQFDLYLPDGVTAVKTGTGKIKASLTADRLPEDDEHTLTVTEQADGAIRFLCGSQYDETFTGTDGEIATLTVDISADMTDGDYPITLKYVKLTETDISNFYLTDEVVSTLTLTGSTDGRVILDETSETVPEIAENVDVRVLRTINANEWSTICLPFSMSADQIQTAFGDDVTVELADAVSYETTEDDDDNIVSITINFNNVSPLAIEANHPYIIKVDKKITSFDVDGVDVNPATSVSGRRKKIGTGSYFIGNYENQTEVPEFSLFLNGNKFWYSTGLTKMKAFRAYFTLRDVLTEVDEAAARIGFSFDEATGIRDNNRETITNNRYYDLQGRSVQTPARKGLYINNGKKVVVK